MDRRSFIGRVAAVVAATRIPLVAEADLPPEASTAAVRGISGSGAVKARANYVTGLALHGACKGERVKVMLPDDETGRGEVREYFAWDRVEVGDLLAFRDGLVDTDLARQLNVHGYVEKLKAVR
jgi:hypothetical protein